MKLSRKWLAEWVAELPDSETLSERLTLAGLEVEAVEPAGACVDGVVVARILSAEKHPEADRLQVCRVDDGSGSEHQIVCGAPNARAGLVAPLARLGTTMPGGMKIKAAKLRGVESAGMLCSGAELGMEGSDGLLELPEDAPLGEPLARYLDLDDEVIEIALTPNRGDCLSVAGVARELGCILDREVVPPFSGDAVAVSTDASIGVEIEDTADCSSYAGRVVRGLDPHAPTPLWMSERLRRAGIRSLGPLVDITNYVLLELGQPMHAFDLERLQGDIGVRRGRTGERLTLLNDQEIEVSADELLITDDSGPIALAGAMGGAGTAIGDDTSAVFLESACFLPDAVTGTGRKYKLVTDALHRFERGVDPALQLRALERATELLIAIAGGEAGPVTLAGALVTGRPPVAVRPERIVSLLGADIPQPEMRRIFDKLGFQTEQGDAQWTVTPPSYRYDIEIEEDLIEEVARVYGYDRIMARERRVPVSLRAPRVRPALDRARDIMVQRGYFETVSYSFVDADTDALLADSGEPIPVDNPMAQTQAQMRRTLWSSLLPLWQHNVQRQQERVRLFECARKYARYNGQIVESECVSGVVSGASEGEQWGLASRAADFHDVKADLEALLADATGGQRTRWEAGRHPALHPGQSAQVLIGDEALGWLGVLHPAVAKKLDLPGNPIVFELDWARVSRAREPGFEPIPEFPSMRRDLALLVPEEVPVGALVEALESAEVTHLRAVRVFDLYRGEALPKGFKSVALGLIFQEKTRTLTDEEVDAAMAGLASRLEKGFGARIRD